MAKSLQWGLKCPEAVEFRNIGTSTFTTGTDEVCDVNRSLVDCPSGDKGGVAGLEGMAVENVEYGTGKIVGAQ